MKEAVLDRLCCPQCRGGLCYHSFQNRGDTDIEQGVVWCTVCRHWYPIEDGLLELLPARLAYRDDRLRFWTLNWRRLEALGIREMEGDARPHPNQQPEHFDWHPRRNDAPRLAYAQLPFQRAVDERFHQRCRRQIKPGKWLLDVGCAQGRHTASFMDLPLHIVGVNRSKALIRQALRQYRRRAYQALATFFVGDPCNLPFSPQSFDYVLLHGVLQQVSLPAATCHQAVQTLRLGGIAFGIENNRTWFQRTDALDRPGTFLRHAGDEVEARVSARQLRQWFDGTPVQVECRSHGFIWPELANRLGRRWGTRLFEATDWIGQRLPWICYQGQCILFSAQRQDQLVARTSSKEAA